MINKNTKFAILAITIITLVVSISGIQYSYATDAPVIVQVRVDDPDDLDGIFSVGDTITITFDTATNMPGGTQLQGTTMVDYMFEFKGPLYEAYTGQWIDAHAFQITITSLSTPYSPDIGETTVTPTGVIPIHSADQLSSRSIETSPVLVGDFGEDIMGQLIEAICTISPKLDLCN